MAHARDSVLEICRKAPGLKFSLSLCVCVCVRFLNVLYITDMLK